MNRGVSGVHKIQAAGGFVIQTTISMNRRVEFSVVR